MGDCGWMSGNEALNKKSPTWGKSPDVKPDVKSTRDSVKELLPDKDKEHGATVHGGGCSFS
jgi:hypothetical protein